MNLHIRKTLIAVSLTGLAAAGAHAQQGNAYVGAAVSAPNYSSSINGVGGGSGGQGPGMKLYGGYKFTPNFALEGGLMELGRSHDVGGTARAYGGYVDGVASTPLAPKWSAYGSLGLAQARFHTSAGNDSSPGLKVGAGLQYELSSTTALRVGLDRYRFSNAFGEKPYVGQTSVGLNMGF